MAAAQGEVTNLPGLITFGEYTQQVVLRAKRAKSNMKDRIELPDGRIIVKRPRGRGHSYITQGGERVPSVTTILGVVNKPGLPNWAARTAAGAAIKQVKDAQKAAPSGVSVSIAQLNEIASEASKAHVRVRDDAADIGTFVHRVVEARLEGQEAIDVPNDIPKYVMRNVDDFFRYSLSEFEVVDREMVVAHPLPYAGTVDAVLMVNGKRVLIDWKTSSGIYPEMSMQVAAYALAYQYSYGKAIDEAWVIRFPKTDDPVDLVISNVKEAWEGFRAAAELHHVMEREHLLWSEIGE